MGSAQRRRFCICCSRRLPLPIDETLWDSLHLVFATPAGNVRRNRLSDFRNVRASGPAANEPSPEGEPASVGQSCVGKIAPYKQKRHDHQPARSATARRTGWISP